MDRDRVTGVGPSLAGPILCLTHPSTRRANLFNVKVLQEYAFLEFVHLLFYDWLLSFARELFLPWDQRRNVSRFQTANQTE